jgi:hypothetical protein
LYPHYADLVHRPGGISALTDQQIAAGIMWSAGDVPFGIAIAWLVHGWLSEQERRTRDLDELAAVPADDPSVADRPTPEAALEPRLAEPTTIASARPAGRPGS